MGGTDLLSSILSSEAEGEEVAAHRPPPTSVSLARDEGAGEGQGEGALKPKRENGAVLRCAKAWMGMACVETRRIREVIRRDSTKVMPAKILRQINAGPFSLLGST